jgi:hypothetical protein
MGHPSYVDWNDGCLGSSLANILIAIGEDRFGARIARGFKKHRFAGVARVGEYAGWTAPVFLVPQLLQEFTDGEYDAKIVGFKPRRRDWHIDYLVLETAYDEAHRYKSKTTCGLAFYEMMKNVVEGKIDLFAGYTSPGLLGMPHHMVANPSPGQIIDNGALKSFRQYRRELRKNGIDFTLGVEVRRSGDLMPAAHKWMNY